IAVVAAEFVKLISLLRGEQTVKRQTTLARGIRVRVCCFFLRDITELQLTVARGHNLIAQQWPTTWRGPKLTAKEGNDRIRNVVLGRIFLEVCWVHACTD